MVQTVRRKFCIQIHLNITCIKMNRSLQCLYQDKNKFTRIFLIGQMECLRLARMFHPFGFLHNSKPQMPFFFLNKNMINLDNCQFLRLLLVQLTSQYCKMHPTRMITRKCGLDVFTTWGKKCIKIKLRITGFWDYAFKGPFLWRKLCWGSQQDHYMFLGNCPPTPPLSQH